MEDSNAVLRTVPLSTVRVRILLGKNLEVQYSYIVVATVPVERTPTSTGEFNSTFMHLADLMTMYRTKTATFLFFFEG